MAVNGPAFGQNLPNLAFSQWGPSSSSIGNNQLGFLSPNLFGAFPENPFGNIQTGQTYVWNVGMRDNPGANGQTFFSVESALWNQSNVLEDNIFQWTLGNLMSGMPNPMGVPGQQPGATPNAQPQRGPA